MTRSPLILLIPAALGLGCAGSEDKGTDTSGSANLTDADGDGYFAEEDDCDDGDLYIYPGAAERCDEVDNNCDGAIDEGVAGTYYTDADSDGFGDPERATTACARPDGTSPLNTDCDDSSADVSPVAEEVCDEVDNDCDGLADDQDDSVDISTGSAFYADNDADGYGDPDAGAPRCAAGDGFVDNSLDCDDADEEIQPGAAEVCDGVDNDCDGYPDAADADVIDAFIAYTDLDLDGYGSETETVSVCELGEGAVADNTDCDDTLDTVNPAAVESCRDEDDNDCDGEVNEDCADCGDVKVIGYFDSFSAGSSPMEDAAELMGMSISALNESTSFATTFDADTWDVLIVDVPGLTLPAAVQSRIESAISAGTVILFSYWYLGYDATTASLLGVTVDSSISSPLPLSAASGSSLWTAWEELPASIASYAYDAGINGQILSAVDSATSETLAVYSGDESSEAIIATLGGQVLVNGFLPWDFQATDDDADGISDMAELYANEMAWALGCSR